MATLRIYTLTHAHTHRIARTHVHTHMHTNAHARAHTQYTDIRTQTYVRTHTRTCAGHTGARTHARTHAQTQKTRARGTLINIKSSHYYADNKLLIVKYVIEKKERRKKVEHPICWRNTSTRQQIGDTILNVDYDMHFGEMLIWIPEVNVISFLNDWMWKWWYQICIKIKNCLLIWRCHSIWQKENMMFHGLYRCC